MLLRLFFCPLSSPQRRFLRLVASSLTHMHEKLWYLSRRGSVTSAYHFMFTFELSKEANPSLVCRIGKFTTYEETFGMCEG